MSLYNDGTPLDELPKYFRGIVFQGGKPFKAGFKGSFEDKDHFKSMLPGAKWSSVEKSFLVEVTNSNQADVFAALEKGFKELCLLDVAIDRVREPLSTGILKKLKQSGVIV